MSSGRKDRAAAIGDTAVNTYAFPPGGMPDQSQDPGGTAAFTDAYAVIPAETQRDIVTSFLPEWENARAWVLARPLSGFAETFAQYALEIAPKGGSNAPEPDKDAQAVLFVAHGTARLTLGQDAFDLPCFRSLCMNWLSRRRLRIPRPLLLWMRPAWCWA